MKILVYLLMQLQTVTVTESPIQLSPLWWSVSRIPNANTLTCSVNGKIEKVGQGIRLLIANNFIPSVPWDSLEWTGKAAVISCSYQITAVPLVPSGLVVK